MVLLRVIAMWFISLLLSLAVPTGVSVAASPVAQSPIYTYDNTHISSVTADAVSERGPHASPGLQFTYDAVDLGPQGTAARHHEAAAGPTTAYTASDEVIQVARTMGTTGTRPQGDGGALSAPSEFEVAAKSVDEVTNVLIAGPRQLQSKFKHAADFGVTGNYNKANAAEFNAAIQQHINAAGTRSIRGIYRGDAVTHFLDPETGLNVISRDGTFVSGWRLNADQLANVLRDGSLGGG